MNGPTVFISYSHLDEPWKDQLVRQLSVLELANPRVLTLVAFGGVGKSALVARWLDGMSAAGWRGAARVLDWSTAVPVSLF